MEERHDYRVFWVLMLVLLVLTRTPLITTYLSIDNVNLAFALDKFDPRIHQPQPPGYPFFVGFARILNFFFRDAERTFIAISLIVSALCLPLAFALGRRMFSPWAGAAGAFLLLVNPVFWFSGIDGPLRPNLALFSLLTAYCCWRCWNGEKRFAMWGAIALGIGSGFRPDLIAFLFPLWLISTWVGARSIRDVAAAGAVLAAIVLVWVSALVIAMGGIETFTQVSAEYAVKQSPESMIFGNPLGAWLRQMSRLVVWNGLTVVTWIWAFSPPLRGGASAPKAETGWWRSTQAMFLLIWIVPGLVAQALIHIAAPGHALASVVAFCLLGGYVISRARVRDALLAPVLVLNAMLFLGFFSVPVGVTNSPDEIPSLKNALLFGTAETSIGLLRSVNNMNELTLKELQEFTPNDRPSTIVTSDHYVQRFFMNWRVARYYLPDRDFWVIYKNGQNHGIEHIRRDTYLGKLENVSVKLPVPARSRILWLIEPQGELHKQLASRYRLGGGTWVFYTDLADDSSPIQLDGVEIVPEAGPGKGE
jgi:hypothetical protein